MSLKILGNLDLSLFPKKGEAKKEKPKKERIKLEIYNKEIDSFLANMSESVNQEFGYFLSPDASIDMASPDYVFPDKQEDIERVKYYETKFAEKESKTRDQWLSERYEHLGPVAEKVVTIILYKFLKDYFLICRTAPHDDYRKD